jgi:probable F420-dependent oxidoreductase
VLPVFGLQPALPTEKDLFPIPAGARRGDVFDEALTLLKRLLTADSPATFSGRFFDVTDADVGPKPAKPLDIWLGGSAPGALRRIGRLGDGWLGSFMAPAEAGEAVRTIQAAAAEAHREVDPEHFGMNIAVSFGPVPAAYAESVARRRPGTDPEDLVAEGWPGARQRIEEFAAQGLSKFVVRAITPDMPADEFTDGLASELKPLQT